MQVQSFYVSGQHIGLAVHGANDMARIRGAVRTESYGTRNKYLCIRIG